MEQAALDSVRETIRKVHGCDSRWVETVQVAEPYWKGEVEVFELLDHPTARRCYGWQQPVGRERRTHVVLEGATVVNAAQAVRATIAARERTRVF